ncbi:hypothetical protein R1flu_006916 [Riccia fluitans]|uniref:IMP-specific 5'-nucleotidase 1 n=1 Tax=Riccia fluitans TaxID=41844 RepID=A0ABD1Z1G9_9MARC
MAFAAYTCGLCFDSYASPLSLASNRSRRAKQEDQRSRSLVTLASKQIPIANYRFLFSHSAASHVTCRGLRPVNNYSEQKVGFFCYNKGFNMALVVYTGKAETHFGSCRCEFGSGRFGRRRGELIGIAATVVGRSTISTFGYGSSKDDAESQNYQDREGAIAACSSSRSVVTAGVEVDVSEQPSSREEILSSELPGVSGDENEAQKKELENDVQPSTSKSGMRWSMLLSTAALEDAHLSRASSVTDAHVLRRKGRLKEQDGLIEFIISMHNTHSSFQVMEKMERWIREHLEDPKRSTLARLVPSVGRFYTPLPLVRALQEYDEFASLSRRRYVPPNFAEIRHVLNIAQVHAIAGQLSLITFDADGTLYADGHHIQRDNKMINHIIKLMQEGCHVAIVTAAGYPGDASRYEGRLAGLLAAFKDLELPPRTTQLFHVMGGECNYLLRVTGDYRLDFVPDDLWKTRDMQEWSEGDVQKLLDEAESSLISAAARLRLPVELIRKPRAVGAIPKEPTIYEVLEEMALTVQMQLIDSELPYCAFNGGNDVFVDVGNKSVGLEALMKFLRKTPKETLHVGDRFTVSGNDSATRSKCSILWVANPEETGFFTRVLLREVQLSRLIPYIE